MSRLTTSRSRSMLAVSAATCTAALAVAGVAPGLAATSVPATAYLSPAGADAALGDYGLDHWRYTADVPRPLRFARTCSTTLPHGASGVLREHRQASIKSVIRTQPTTTQALEMKRRAAGRVLRCIDSRPPGHAELTNLYVKDADSDARVFGVVLGAVSDARKVEYVVVAHSGRAAEVSTLHVFAQGAAPRSELRHLAIRVLRRLANAT
ncbi:MAG: hypothetical protein ACR2KL_02295 [Nocardioidaceae bacterium]